MEYLAFISGGTTVKGRIPIVVENKEKIEEVREKIEQTYREINSVNPESKAGQQGIKLNDEDMKSLEEMTKAPSWAVREPQSDRIGRK